MSVTSSVSSWIDCLHLTEEEKQSIRALKNTELRAPNEWIESEDGTLMHASVPQLILNVLQPSGTDANFMQQFLYCLPSFTRPEFVLASFVTRFYEAPNDDTPAKKRVLKVIRWWADLTPWQFTKKMLGVLKDFGDSLATDAPDLAEIVSDAHQKAKHPRKPSIIFQENPPEVLLPDGDPRFWLVPHIPALELARQLTIFHSETFASISSRELVSGAWGLKGTTEPEALRSLSHHFDCFANLVSLSTIAPSTLAEMANVHSFWIDVCVELRKLSNYTGIFMVICGLTHQSVVRLEEVVRRSLRSTRERQSAYAELVEVCDFANNYAKYRGIVESLEEPCVPFLGTFQKDFVYVNESYPNRVNGLVNFEKCVETTKLILRIRRFQKSRYNLRKDEKLQELITKTLPEPLDTGLMMKISRQACL